MMKPLQNRFGKKSRWAFLITCSTIMLFAFQNCSGGLLNGGFEALSIENDPFGSGAIFQSVKCDPQAAVQPTENRRLTKAELSNTLRDLLGGSPLSADIAAQISRLPEDDIAVGVDRFRKEFTSQHIAVFVDLATTVGSQVAATNADLNALLAGHSTCKIETMTAVCAEEFIKNFGMRAWRRELAAADVTKFKALYSEGVSALDKFSLVISSLLIAPEFSYHIELGSAVTGSDQTFPITQYEIANRLSYGLWSTMPSKDLFAKAAKNQLSDEAVLASTVEQMMADPRAKDRIKGFFSFWLGLYVQPGIPSQAAFLNGIDTNGLTAEMSRELFAYIDYVVMNKNGGFSDLMSSDVSFAATPALASIYGHGLSSNPASGDQKMSPDRKGLLMRGPFLISTNAVSKPITRGVLIRQRILCDKLGQPDPSAFAAAAQINSQDFLLKYTNRQRVHMMTGGGSCYSCHSQINPLGYALETYDSLGRLRNMESVFNTQQQLIATHPIDTEVSGLNIDNIAEARASSAAGLMDTLAQSDQAVTCTARQMHRYFNLREEKPFESDGCQILDAKTKLKGEGGFLGALKSQVLNRYLGQKSVAQ